MKVKVRRVNDKKDYSHDMGGKNILIPVECLNRNNIKIQIEANTCRDMTADCAGKSEPPSEEQKGRMNFITTVFTIIFARAKNLAKNNQDGTLTVKVLSSSLMRLTAYFGYLFSLYLPCGTVYELYKLYDKAVGWTSQFVVKTISSLLLSLFISIFVAVLAKGLEVDAIKLEENKKPEQVYSMATLIATILIGILTLR